MVTYGGEKHSVEEHRYILCFDFFYKNLKIPKKSKMNVQMILKCIHLVNTRVKLRQVTLKHGNLTIHLLWKRVEE